jgi:hypothetical protein
MNKTSIIFLALSVMTVFLVSAIDFQDLSPNWGSDTFTITGTVNGGAGQPVIPLCDNLPIDTGLVTTLAADDGHFSFFITHAQCEEGHQISFKSNDVTSQALTVVKDESTGGIVVESIKGPSIHAPEFSILTLAIAVIGAGLGLAFLRKH